MHWRLSRLKVWTPARTGNGLRRSGGLCSGVRMSRRQVPSAKHRRGRSVRRMQGGRRGPSTGTASRGLSWLLPSTARSLRILLRTSLDDRRRIRSDRAVLRLPGSRLVASLAGLAARAMRALWNACRPTSVAGGFIVDLTRSRAELVTENALLRQQLIVASRAVKRPAFRVHERGLLVLLASLYRQWRHALLLVTPETGFDCSGVGDPARSVHASRVSRRTSSPSSTAWRPRTGSGEPNGFEASS